MKTKMKMRLLSFMLCFVMLVGLMPTSAFAAEKEDIDSISATVTLPVAGASPSFEAVAGGEGYTAEVEWESEDAQLYPADGYEFKAGEKYYLFVTFNAKDGYEFADDVTITINGKTPEQTGKEGNIIWGLVTYTLSAATPITSVEVSDVTAPTIGATPDFDITLTGEGAALYEYEEDEWEAITWEKFDPETGEWEPMDEDTPFGAGLYCLGVALQFEEGYAFTDATKFYYNDDELPEYGGSYESNYQRWEGGAYIFLYFTLEEIADTTVTIEMKTGDKVDDFTGAAEVGLDCLVYHNLLVADVEVKGFRNARGKLLFTVDDETGVITIADGVTEEDAISYELPPDESAYVLEDYGIEMTKVILTFVPEGSAAPEKITSLSATVTLPVAGASPSFEAVAGGEGYTAEVEWESEDAQLYPADGYEFKAGEKYYLFVVFNAKDGYEFADDVTITINGKTPEQTGKDGNTIWGLVTYTLSVPENPVYGIVVNNGKSYVGAGTEITEAEKGTKIIIKADKAAEGKEFDKWVVNNGTITLADATKAETTFDMPAERVQVTATYKDKVVTPPADDEGGEDTTKPEYTTKPKYTTKPEDKPFDSPQTGDNSMIWLWIALLFVSGAGVVETTVAGKKRFSVK